MRHKVAGFKLKRDPSARKALLRGLVTSVIEQERVITTVPKAKAVKPLVDKMITLAKRDTLHARRQAAAFLETPASVQKLFEKLGTRFGQRAGGYTRIVRLGWRQGRRRRAGHARTGRLRAGQARRRSRQAPRGAHEGDQGRPSRRRGRGAASLGLTHKKQERRRIHARRRLHFLAVLRRDYLRRRKVEQDRSSSNVRARRGTPSAKWHF